MTVEVTLRTETKRKSIEPGIYIICGPMFSGKTGELIRQLSTLPYAGFKVKAFKPERDTRRGVNTINTENGSSFPATSVSSSRKILRLVKGIDVIGIDEAQFFDKNLPWVCLKLVKRGKKVLIAGLDRDFKGEPFGPMGELMLLADHINTVHAYCVVCGLEASFSQRIVNGRPASYNEKVIVVGATELYEARCRLHHEVPGKPVIERVLEERNFDNVLYQGAFLILKQRSHALVDEYLETRDFKNLLKGASEEKERVEEEGIVGGAHVSIMITDMLANSEGGNEALIEHSRTLGIDPQKNYVGVRLQAMSCLSQILESEETE